MKNVPCVGLGFRCVLLFRRWSLAKHASTVGDRFPPICHPFIVDYSTADHALEAFSRHSRNRANCRGGVAF